MTTFVLVHGAWHGAWCWERLTPELEERGHRAIGVELPGEDTAAGCADYARVVVAAVGHLSEDLVVVGHSLGGLTIPLVAAVRPVRRLIFLCAMIPRPGLSLVEQLKAEPEIFARGFEGAPARDELERSYWPDREEAISALYPDCPRQLGEWAVARLRSQARLPNVERCPLSSWPGVPSSYVLGKDDAALNPDWCRRAARERLGTAVSELSGGHSPFLSRPDELADALVAECA
jgi:pimeloyl-ACP methyl ester carboxylesterase